MPSVSRRTAQGSSGSLASLCGICVNYILATQNPQERAENNVARAWRL